MKLLSLYRAKKSYLLNSVISAFVIALLFVVIDAFQEWKEPQLLYLQVSMKSSVTSIAQIFYDIGNKFNEKDSKSCKVYRGEEFQVINFPLPKAQIQNIRFDPLTEEGNFSLRDICIVDESNRLIKTIELQRVIPLQQISSININNNSLMAATEANANDPMLSLDLEYPILLNLKSPLILRIKGHIVGMFNYAPKKFCFVFVISLAAMLFVYSGQKRTEYDNKTSLFTSLFFFIKLIFQQKHLILSMAKREVQTQYVGSVLGFIWTFINPIVMIFVFWVVFSVGFRVQPTNNVPFVVWLTAGMAAWFVFADIVSGSAGAVVSNAHLIKKTLFQSHILPVVKTVSCLVTHAVFLFVLIGLIVFQKMPFSFYYFQFIYYLICLTVLALGIGWAVSALNVFFRDIAQIVGVIIQMGFWATPIFWDVNILPPRFQIIFKLNPMFYIVQGYRESFIYFQPFWVHPRQTLYFWTVALTVFVVGALVFKKLKPQFADVL